MGDVPFDSGWLVVVGLAVFRVWWLLAHDSILSVVRARLSDRVAGWLECPWCGGFWLSVVAVAVWVLWGDVSWVRVGFVVWAVAGVVGILGRYVASDVGTEVTVNLYEDDEGVGVEVEEG